MLKNIDPEVLPLIPKYLTHRLNDLDGIRCALADDDFATVTRFGHSMKGSGSSYGLDPISEMGALIEKAGLAKDVDRVLDVLTELEDFLKKVLDSEDLNLNADRNVRRVLCVDDNEDVTDLLEMILIKGGLDVEVIHDAELGLERMSRGGIDLLLLDVSMPKMNGFEFMEKMNACGSKVPVVFLTASQSEEDELRGLTLGARDYIIKPFSSALIHSRVVGLMHRLYA
ncbi:MAG: response regulator [Zetaproteobacteria bacterium]|nr:response regulator [Zetaproteobacteria bacterium]